MTDARHGGWRIFTPRAPPRFDLRGIIGSLMLAENFGDVHDVINHLCDLAGLPRPEGGFMDGWTDADHAMVSDPE